MPVLVGEFDAEVLHSGAYSWFEAGYLAYEPEDAKLFAKLQASAKRLSALVFLGTWCGDTHDHLPAFLKLLDQARVPRERVRLIGLDRDKKWKGLPEQHGIERLPTFLIYAEPTKEIGRIVETPKVSMLADLVQLVEAFEKNST